MILHYIRRLYLSIFISISFLLTSSCTTSRISSPIDNNSSPSAQSSVASHHHDKPQKPIEYGTFEEQSLYELLVAEIAGQRGQLELALNNYVRQARYTRDLSVIIRATTIASYLSAHDEAIEMALLWHEKAPSNLTALKISINHLAIQSRFTEAIKYASRLLALDNSADFPFIASKLENASTTELQNVSQLINTLLNLYPDKPELLFAKAIVTEYQQQHTESIVLINKLLDLDYRSTNFTIFSSKVLSANNHTEQALNILKQHVNQIPNNRHLRLQYARILTKSDNFKAARQQFDILLQQSPHEISLLLPLALVNIELMEYDLAFEHLLALTQIPAYQSDAYFYLAYISEEQKKLQQAVQFYKRVNNSHKHFFRSNARLSRIYMQLNKEDEGLEYIRQQRQQFPDHAVNFYLLEADILVEKKQFQLAYTTLDNALNEHPDDHELLYNRAMISEKLDNLSQLEEDLRKIITLDPNHATALNALGYTLADRTERYQEALELISRALKISPGNPAVIDSLGWVQYRMGDFDAALLSLRKAIKLLPDHEVAAHLGEVLWVTGQREEADKIWREALEKQPNSELLKSIMKKFSSGNSTVSD